MTIFLILAPYGAFATLMLFTSAAVSLFAATAICLMVIAYDAARGRSIKMLGAGSAILFTALGCYLTLVDAGWSISAVKLTVDAGDSALGCRHGRRGHRGRRGRRTRLAIVAPRTPVGVRREVAAVGVGTVPAEPGQIDDLRGGVRIGAMPQ